MQMRGVPAERKAELEARHGEARRQRKAEEAAKVAAGKDGGGGQTTGDNGTEAAEARRWKRVEQAAAEGAQGRQVTMRVKLRQASRARRKYKFLEATAS